MRSRIHGTVLLRSLRSVAFCQISWPLEVSARVLGASGGGLAPGALGVGRTTLYEHLGDLPPLDGIPREEPNTELAA